MHQTQQRAQPPIYLFLLSIPERVLNVESKSTMTQGYAFTLQQASVPKDYKLTECTIYGDLLFSSCHHNRVEKIVMTAAELHKFSKYLKNSKIHPREPL
jgi:hypothetical protein